MHYKVIIVKPVEMRLNDVMYPFQELDKTQEGIMNDDRGVFIKLVDEAQVPLLFIIAFVWTKIDEFFNRC